MVCVYLVTPPLLDHGGRWLLRSVTPTSTTQVLESPIHREARLSYARWLALAAGIGLARQVIADRPRRSRSWDLGASGERATGADLARIEGVVVLHDRLMPRSRANIDHIAVTPAGVFVVETKRCAVAPELRRGSLFYRGRNVDRWFEQVHGQARAVEVALGSLLIELPVAVRPVVCIQGARVSGRSVVEGVPILTGRQLVKRVEKSPAVIGSADRERIAARLRESLKPAVPAGS